MNTSSLLEKHLKYGNPMPLPMHIVYHNCCDRFGFSEMDKRIISSNINIYARQIKTFKKCRRGIYANISINKKALKFILESIDQYYDNIRLKKTNDSTRKQFNAIRNKVFIKLTRSQKSCLFCGSIKKLSVDHIIPISKGGGNEFKNFQILCKSCNSKKSNKLNYGKADSI